MLENIPTHTFSDDTNLLFQVQPLDAKASDDTSIPHRHDYVALFLLKEAGSGYHEIDFIRHSVPLYSIHFVNREQVHQLQRSRDKSSGTVVLFNPEFVFGEGALVSSNKQLSVLSIMNRFPVLELDEETFGFFHGVMQTMHRELSTPTRFTSQALASFCYILLARYQHLVEQYEGGFSRQHSVASRFLELVNEHLKTHRQVQDYAGMLHVGPKTLGRLCQETLGKTPLEIIQGRLLVEVKRLAYYTEKSVKEIADELSFNDSSHLNKFFKSHTGQTLSEFREHYQSH